MRKMMDNAFKRFGTDAAVQTAAGCQKVKVFFHSINSTSWQNMERVFSPLGEVPCGQYICVLPVQTEIATHDTVLIGDRAYLVRKVERMDIGDTALYHWALCVEKGVEDRWD